jgi:hypothetical protein
MMTIRLYRTATAALALTLLACAPQAVPQREALNLELEVGRPFPEIALPRLTDGSPATIAQFRGRKLLLHIFASW